MSRSSICSTTQPELKATWPAPKPYCRVLPFWSYCWMVMGPRPKVERYRSSSAWVMKVSIVSNSVS